MSGDVSKLTIDCTDITLPYGSVVKLNDAEIPGLTSLTLKMSSEEVNQLTLVIAVDDVQITSAVFTALEAFVKEDDDG